MGITRGKEMNLKKRYRHWQERWARMKKVRAQLPKYNPHNGQRLYWHISLGRWRNQEFNVMTGKRIKGDFDSTPVITQERPPRGSGQAILRYDWKTKKLTSSSATW